MRQELYPFAYMREGETTTFTFLWKRLFERERIVNSTFTLEAGVTDLVIVDSWINDRVVHEDWQGFQSKLPFRRSTSVKVQGVDSGDFQITNEVETTSGDILRRTRVIKVRDRYPYSGGWSIPREQNGSPYYG